MPDTVLETQNLTKKFGGVTAVEDVNMEVEKGKLWAIIGPNGAGKTTFFNLISGVHKPTSGRVFYKNQDITDKRPDQRSQMGMVRSFQLTQIFPNLTTLENIRLAAQSREGFRVQANVLNDAMNYQSLIDKSVELLEKFEMDDKMHAIAKDLSGADKRKLDIIIALASDPHLLLLDEPTSGMAVEEIPEIMDIIVDLNSERDDLTILFIEHKVEMVMDIAEYISVLDDGRLIAEGKPEEISEDEKVQEAYLGGLE